MNGSKSRLGSTRAETRKGKLPSNAERLVNLMQSIGFGSIQQLRIRDGEPDFTVPFKSCRTVKISAQNGPHFPVGRRDYVLKKEIVELFDHFARLGNGTVTKLEIRHGLPVLFELTETVPE